MISCLLTTFIEDEILKSTCDFNPDRIMGGEVVYEVLKVEQGVPLFLEKHLARFNQSLSLAKIPVPSEEMIRHSLQSLIETNKLRQGNIRFQIALQQNNTIHWSCWVSPHLYPSLKQYDEGVHTGVFKSERQHPEIKRWNDRFKTDISSFLNKTGFHEALLMNSHGLITEGSRSNVFFIIKNQVITPEIRWVLPGVTRSVVIELINTLQLSFVEEPVTQAVLSQIDAAFITGTSPGILPIQSIDQKTLNTDHPITCSLQESYKQLCSTYFHHFHW